VLDHLDLGTIALPFGADRVDLDELFRRQETLGDQTAIDQLGPRIVLGRNEIAPAKPDVAEPAAALLAARFQ